MCLCVSVKIERALCVGKSYIRSSATCSARNYKYLGSIIDHSVLRCDEIMNAAVHQEVLLVLCQQIFIFLLVIILLLIMLLFVIIIQNKIKIKERIAVLIIYKKLVLKIVRVTISMIHLNLSVFILIISYRKKNHTKKF